ncbi:MAG TPA: hypothetical protein VIJ17_06815, partial [Pseudolabrys sp.]
HQVDGLKCAVGQFRQGQALTQETGLRIAQSILVQLHQDDRIGSNDCRNRERGADNQPTQPKRRKSFGGRSQMHRSGDSVKHLLKRPILMARMLLCGRMHGRLI